jgi:hypothetical protein
MQSSDLNRLATALEYADLGATLYLGGGSDHAARLLAAAAEQVLGEVVRLVDGPFATDDTLELLKRIASSYQPKSTPPPATHRRLIPESPVGEDPLRAEAEAYLRATWFMLESIGVGALAPPSLLQAVEKTTVFGNSGATLEPFC